MEYKLTLQKTKLKNPISSSFEEDTHFYPHRLLKAAPSVVNQSNSTNPFANTIPGNHNFFQSNGGNNSSILSYNQYVVNEERVKQLKERIHKEKMRYSSQSHLIEMGIDCCKREKEQTQNNVLNR
mmetsp:Transcript_33569/g.34865  ORF Transcript_33569/g.34865 Transcript_33569/m.34865 type:complete len:125 (+) Transcript_33569:55-429(+)